jgi:hypothetical protein
MLFEALQTSFEDNMKYVADLRSALDNTAAAIRAEIGSVMHQIASNKSLIDSALEAMPYLIESLYIFHSLLLSDERDKNSI